MISQQGLKWASGTFGLEPRWTEEPSVSKIESLARRHLKVLPSSPCRVTFYAQGAFNKLYKIQADEDYYLMRVTLPVDPFYKTNSEVATIRFVRKNTDIPVPRIFAFDDSSKNELGFEWILMEMLPGVTLRARWRKLSEEAKQKLIEQVVIYQVQLLTISFPAIGNIYTEPQAEPMSWTASVFLWTLRKSLEHVDYVTRPVLQAGPWLARRLNDYLGVDAYPGQGLRRSRDSPLAKPAQDVSDSMNVHLGRLVSLIFFWGDHIAQDVPRGPFTNSQDWIRARLDLVLVDLEKVMKTSKKIIGTSNNEDDIEEAKDNMEEAEDAKEIAEKLLKLLPTIFSTRSHIQDLARLFHDDLSMQNILVGIDGKITGVVDWECVSTLPLWKTYELPQFLKGRDRYERPRRDQYGPDDGVNNVGEPGGSVLDNEGMNSLYWEHLLEYELTMLRDLFWKEIGSASIKVPENNAVKLDFEEAVQHCDSGWRTKKIKSWLDALEKGDHWSLRQKFLE